MNKILSFIILIFLFITILSGCIKETEKEKTSVKKFDIYVDDDGQGEFYSIQSAINEAKNNDLIFVFSGIYNENIIINKSITLIGEKRENTIINGNGTGNVIYVSSDFVNITSFTINNSGEIFLDAGIKLGSDYNKIINNIINSSNIGISLGGLSSSSNNNNISNNNFTNNKDAINFYDACNNTLFNNNIFNNEKNSVSIFYESYHNILKHNNIFDNHLGIYISQSKNNIINENKIIKNNYGIYFDDSDNNKISNNYISNNDYYGLSLNNCEYNIIENNNIGSNEEDSGINLDGSSNNVISENNITNNNDGISLLYLSNNNSICDNKINNNGYGISLHSSKNNTIYRNNLLSNNGNGIHIYSSSNNNIIYHNNLINNLWNCSDECNNFWYNITLEEGNFWGDFIGFDNDSDGIGDTNYSIDGGNNKDFFPLIEPKFLQDIEKIELIGQYLGCYIIEENKDTKITMCSCLDDSLINKTLRITGLIILSRGDYKLEYIEILDYEVIY